MQIVIDIPIYLQLTEEELKNEFEEQTEDFRRRGLLPIESIEADATESEEQTE